MIELIIDKNINFDYCLQKDLLQVLCLPYFIWFLKNLPIN